MEDIKYEIDRIVGCNLEVTEDTHKQLCDDIYNFIESKLKITDEEIEKEARDIRKRSEERYKEKYSKEELDRGVIAFKNGAYFILSKLKEQ